MDRVIQCNMQIWFGKKFDNNPEVYGKKLFFQGFSKHLNSCKIKFTITVQ